MQDQTAERNERLKATMRDQNSTNLNRSGKDGVVVCSPNSTKNGKVTTTTEVSKPKS